MRSFGNRMEDRGMFTNGQIALSPLIQFSSRQRQLKANPCPACVGLVCLAQLILLAGGETQQNSRF